MERPLARLGIAIAALCAGSALAAPNGYHDTTNSRLVRGWTCDPDHPGETVVVAIQEGDRLIGYALAGDYRSDLHAVCGDNPNHAFNFDWNQASYDPRDGRSHTISAYARDARTGEWRLLETSPQTVVMDAPLALRLTDEADTSSFAWIDTDGPSPAANTGFDASFNARLTDLVGSYTGVDANRGAVSTWVDAVGTPSAAVQVRPSDGTMGLYFREDDAASGERHYLNPTDGYGPLFKPYPDGTGYLVISFEARAKTLQGLAYGHPTIGFFDNASQRDWYLTVGTYGYDSTYGPAPRPTDPDTGFPIMTTWFGAPDRRYGTTIDGHASTCSGDDMQPVCTALTHFELEISQDQFRNILEALAAANPALGISTDVRQHEVHDFHFNNEISGKGSLGVTLRNVRLQSYY